MDYKTHLSDNQPEQFTAKSINQRGFALIATILIMSLLSVLSFAILSISTVENRSVDSSRHALEAKANGEAISIGVVCNVVDLLQRLLDRKIEVDTLTDQTSAHDELIGYFPANLSVEKANELREKDPEKYKELSLDTMAQHVKLMLELQKNGAITFDYGNNLRGQAKDRRGVENAFDFPGFVPAYIRPLFCEGIGPFRWVALSGDPEDIYKTSCAACHATDAIGAPMFGNPASWAPRIAKGEETLIKNAIEGINAMPPMGTCATCSTEEIAETVKYMVANSQ